MLYDHYDYSEDLGMNDFGITKCPFCGGTELAHGYQTYQAEVIVYGKMLSSSALYHILCTDCGSVVHSYVEKPEKFRK